MREIGGYFELECGHIECPRQGVFLNSGSSAYKYILKQLDVRRIRVPYYTCKCIAREAKKVGCDVIEYQIGDDFMPAEELPINDFILYNNYFGVCGQKVDKVAAKYPNLIVDNAQAFYSEPRGIASFCSPHKFFGVPDGGIASLSLRSVKKEVDIDIPRDHSVSRMGPLLTRIDFGASAGYKEYRAGLEELAAAPVMAMSRLTVSLLGNINYGEVAKVRLRNFNYLHSRLQSEFPFEMADDDVPMVYPYITDNPKLRENLIHEHIYVAKYWPDVICSRSMEDRIIPLPIDQRYGLDDMARICDAIKAFEG